MPRKLPRGWQDRVIGALRAGADMELAARASGVSRRTIYVHLDESLRFAEEIRFARAYADEIVQRSLFEAARGEPIYRAIMDERGNVRQEIVGYKDPNIAAATFWLKNRRPEWRAATEGEPDDARGLRVTINLVPGVDKSGARIVVPLEQAKRSLVAIEDETTDKVAAE